MMLLPHRHSSHDRSRGGPAGDGPLWPQRKDSSGSKWNKQPIDDGKIDRARSTDTDTEAETPSRTADEPDRVPAAPKMELKAPDHDHDPDHVLV
ncbi:unnamed protein product [Heligmosomoides polygyrus]|uniref:Uncharacterized protein n=1 Tax=Heligmosomoides polygyrus TaxID=6339 RepID=A0A183FX40_HELPZ|nr:unnamed protein product [Heligmosomoides polygyrus]